MLDRKPSPALKPEQIKINKEPTTNAFFPTLIIKRLFVLGLELSLLYAYWAIFDEINIYH